MLSLSRKPGIKKKMIRNSILIYLLLLTLPHYTLAQTALPYNAYDSTSSYPRLTVERHKVYEPFSGFMFSHHPFLVYFNYEYIAMWSSGIRDEDEPGQRVVISRSRDFVHWSAPELLAEPSVAHNKKPAILTAAGFYIHDNLLTAYFGSYDSDRTHSRLIARTSSDGITWSPALDLHLPVIPNHAPISLMSGRLLICGNFSFPWTDNPSGLNGWQMSGFYPQELGNISDNPWSFWKVSKGMELPVSLCEGSFYQTEDSVLHMLLRSAGTGFAGYLWLTESKDNGISWSRPVETKFTDNDHKFQFGRLPDGKFFYVGCPVAFPRGRRCPLVFSVSTDGIRFCTHYIIADQPYERKAEGRFKGGEYGYPTVFTRDNRMYIIVSRQKEGVEVIRFDLTQLH